MENRNSFEKDLFFWFRFFCSNPFSVILEKRLFSVKARTGGTPNQRARCGKIGLQLFKITQQARFYDTNHHEY